MTYRTIEDELALHGRGFFQTVGDSMEPLLHNRKSTVVIEEKIGPLKQYDVVLYRRPTGQYVLHRIIKVLDGAYLVRGDNRIWNETVPEEWILGVMVGFFKDEQNNYISCERKVYRRYMKSLKYRYSILWFRNLYNNIRRKLYC